MQTVIGMLISIVGVGLICFGDSKKIETGLLGDVIIICSIWLWAVYSIIVKKIAQFGLQKDFLLLGAVENPYPYYVQTDIYVHATRFEGKSIAIQEAQILGCPVIASDCNGNREQIENGIDGILCSLTPEAIADSIKELIADPKKREKYAKRAQNRNTQNNDELDLLLNMTK